MRQALYLMSPYSDPSPEIRLMRECAAEEAASLLMNSWAVFSPIIHGTRLHRERERRGWPPISHKGWMDQDIAWLRRADAAYLLPLEGWRTSLGVQEELDFCRAARIPIYGLISPVFKNYPLDLAGVVDTCDNLFSLE